MNTHLDCIPCLLRQVLSAARRSTTDVVLLDSIVRDAMGHLNGIDMDSSPPEAARILYALVRERTEASDAFKEVKHASNDLALDLYPELHQRIAASPDPLLTSIKLAIAGNIIDFGALSSCADNDVHRSIEESLRTELPAATVTSFRRALSSARTILYLGDNAGEIVFDKLFIERLLPSSITFAVRGFPIINDATRADADETGLSELVPVIDNGSDAPGTVLDLCSHQFRKCYERADVVIAKGQGNYETLVGENKHIFFLMKVKCPIVADALGCTIGSSVILENIPA